MPQLLSNFAESEFQADAMHPSGFAFSVVLEYNVLRMMTTHVYPELPAPDHLIAKAAVENKALLGKRFMQLLKSTPLGRQHVCKVKQTLRQRLQQITKQTNRKSQETWVNERSGWEKLLAEANKATLSSTVKADVCSAMDLLKTKYNAVAIATINSAEPLAVFSADLALELCGLANARRRAS